MPLSYKRGMGIKEYVLFWALFKCSKYMESYHQKCSLEGVATVEVYVSLLHLGLDEEFSKFNQIFLKPLESIIPVFSSIGVALSWKVGNGKRVWMVVDVILRCPYICHLSNHIVTTI